MFATSRDKRPVDGNRKSIVKDANDFAMACNKSTEEIIVILITTMSEKRGFLDQRWLLIHALKGI